MYPYRGPSTDPANDDEPVCGVPSAVVSHGFWQRQLGGDPAGDRPDTHINGRPVRCRRQPPGFLWRRGWTSVRASPSPSAHRLARRRTDAGSRKGTMWWLTVMGRMAPRPVRSRSSTSDSAASPGLFEASLPATIQRDLVKDYLGLHAAGGIPVAWACRALRQRAIRMSLVILHLTARPIVLLSRRVAANLANLVLFPGHPHRDASFAVRLASAARGAVSCVS